MTGEEENAAFERQVGRIREAGALGKSTALVRLFEYLVGTSRAGRSPKELEVADAVFARGDGFDAMQDASVRVYVHRLRKKLEEFYAGPGAMEPERLVMLRGEYRLTLAQGAPSAPAAPQAPAAAIVPFQPTRRAWLLPALLGAAASALMALGAWAVLDRPDGPDRDLAAVRATPLWAQTLTPGKPIVVVLGDYYIFGERDATGQVARLVREYAINSRYDLDEHVMQHPELNGRYVDLGLRYYPIGVATALRDVMPVLRTAGRREHLPRVIPASDLTPDMLRISNVVYIGYLSGLGALRNPVFNGSRLAVGGSYDELVDRPTHRIYTASTGMPSNGPQQDYGYVAAFPGPNGNRIVVIAGTRDAAVMQAGDYATQRATAQTLDPTDAPGFEALLRVDTLGDQNLAGRLLFAAPIDPSRTWRSTAPQTFPDDAETARRP